MQIVYLFEEHILVKIRRDMITNIRTLQRSCPNTQKKSSKQFSLNLTFLSIAPPLSLHLYPQAGKCKHLVNQSLVAGPKVSHRPEHELISPSDFVPTSVAA